MRFITQDANEVPLAYEEGMILAREKNLSEDFIWLWKHPKVIYMVKNGSILYVGKDYIDSVGYPLVRSDVFPGTAKSAVIAGDDYGLLCSIKNPSFDVKKVLYVDLFQKIANHYGVETEFTGNDIIVKGTTRKMFGMVWRKEGDVQSGHCMFSATTPQVDLSKIFLVRDDIRMFKPEDRITDIEKETGMEPTKEEITNIVRGHLAENGITIEETLITPDEINIINSLKEKHTSEEWLTYGRIAEQPDFK